MVRNLIAKLAVPVPEAIREDYDVLRARRMIGQCRLLYVGLMATVPPAMLGASAATPAWAAFWLPLGIFGLLLLGFVMLLPLRPDRITPRFARKFVFDATWSSPITGFLCGVWCTANWWYSPDEARAYFPLILALGSLATCYCLAPIRPAAILNMIASPLPMALLMLSSGHHMDVLSSFSLFIAYGFLLRLSHDQQQQTVEMLMLQHEVKQLANTDPLTGLLNRRALADAVADLPAEQGYAIVLLDLDGFKPVNDRHGHGVGDDLLCEIGQRLRYVAGPEAHVARLGGDEFALLLPGVEKAEAQALTQQLLAALVQPFALDGHVVRIGASTGLACFPHDGPDITALIKQADLALYALKNERRSRRGALAASEAA
jgi:diguanylate cyclase